ncbi:transcriptional regulator [Paenibacillus sambharensis]|uniref:Transcriptional regulator n=1 Tax=Paenibacillus sambharensis TaxID=1803190 RepID=A0A2W1L1D6_9BACL|nr:winged helix-turn-helix domain-containing protein [Paenibacillus sambharensis]PZD93176.1 transcriptional regulator [Paenibacillus sambharensis]
MQNLETLTSSAAGQLEAPYYRQAQGFGYRQPAGIPVCSQTKRIAVVSPVPDRMYDLIREISANCFDVMVFRKLESLTESGPAIDMYLFDFVTEDVYGDYGNIKAFVSHPDIAARSIYLADRGALNGSADGGERTGEQVIAWPCPVSEAMYAIFRMLTKQETLKSTVSAGSDPSIIMYKDLKVDAKRMSVYRGDDRIELTKTEYEVLLYLLEADGAVLTRDEIMQRICGSSFVGGSNVIDVHVRSLRKKLGDKAVSSKYIVTMRGAGYRMADIR